MEPAGRSVRIGGASGFWGDSSVGAPQLVAQRRRRLPGVRLPGRTHHVDPGRRRGQEPRTGLRHRLRVGDDESRSCATSWPQGIRVVSNAGGVNPQACAAAHRGAGGGTGRGREDRRGERATTCCRCCPQLRAAEPPCANCRAARRCRDRLLTANAYLGALPVKARAGRRRAGRHHRPLRRQRRDAGRADA